MSQVASGESAFVSSLEPEEQPAAVEPSINWLRWCLIPAALAVSLAVFGWWTQFTIEQTLKQNLGLQLQSILAADQAALRVWLAGRRANAESIAADKSIHNHIIQLAHLAAQDPTAATENIAASLLQSPALLGLREHFDRWNRAHGIEGFLVLSAQGRILAGDQNLGIGDMKLAEPFRAELQSVLKGSTIVTRPQKRLLALPDGPKMPRIGQPVMFVAAPVRSAGLSSEQPPVVAALCLRIRPDAEFTQIMRVAVPGRSGETYAFDQTGRLLSNSRFDDDLKRIGLLPDEPGAQSMLELQLRDPGVNLLQGLRPTQRREQQPLTRMAASATTGQAGVDVEGYRDYRGAQVVGAWTWLNDEGIGLATELDVAEAYEPLYALRGQFYKLTALLSAAALGMFGLAIYAAKMKQRARRASLVAQRLGQYALDEKIGAGGMGVVYRARHQMLHRPTAVKILQGKIDESTIARFEREVQLTSRLTHPNTIAVYDFGRTQKGVFYYAMEYLEGESLEDLIAKSGPMPEGRVVYILQQLCGSLTEAHDLGLIHRDIKPGNIMLTKYAGMYDFVKLLDFGLALPQDACFTSQSGLLMGTPQYMSPEVIEMRELDARSDLYAVGAVAYFLLCGKPVFEGQSTSEIFTQQLNAIPVLPSLRLGRAIDRDLELIVMGCLAKQPQDRPASAELLATQLSACQSAKEWLQVDAKEWWQQRVITQPTVIQADTIESNLTTTVVRSHWRD